MARSRNIKPGFFLNDKLAECEPLARLLFAGLWCIADREGRLEDRPKRIKAEILPYDDCDVDQLLNQLAERGFIIRYEVDGSRYIQVTNFSKHQNPHVREAASTLPPPPGNELAPEKNHTSTGKAPEKHDKDPADSLKLIPDSRTRCTDSRATRSGTGGGSDINNDNGDGLKKIYDAFSQNIHPITPFEAESLAGWLDDGMQPDVIIWAIRQAVMQGKRTAKYIDAIIRNLHAEGITTAAAAEARERERANEKMQGPGRVREPTRLSPEEKERIAELNRQLSEALNINRAFEEEVPPWEQ